MSAVTWAAVALLGGAGAVARFVVDGAVAGRVERDLPVGTLAVNLSGAFLLGLVAGLALTGDALLLVGTATLGSYTTFSTWMLETQRLVEDGGGRDAVVNIVLSLAAGIAAVALGRAIG
jgi:fluoride exporter